jgi:catechol 2,3-dioxygenase-like lactoylglutathione lyase family enzyme
MLASSGVATRLPAQNLERARAFYAEKLGLEPMEERPGGLLYRCARGEFALFQEEPQMSIGLGRGGAGISSAHAAPSPRDSDC